MNVTSIQKQVTDFSFVLSQQDLERYLADPKQWAADVKAQLNGQIAQPLARLKVGRGRRARKAQRPNGRAAHRNGSKGGLLKVFCPECGQEIAEKYLPNHREKKHGWLRPSPAAATVSAAKSVSTN